MRYAISRDWSHGMTGQCCHLAALSGKSADSSGTARCGADRWRPAAGSCKFAAQRERGRRACRRQRMQVVQLHLVQHLQVYAVSEPLERVCDLTSVRVSMWKRGNWRKRGGASSIRVHPFCVL